MHTVTELAPRVDAARHIPERGTQVRIRPGRLFDGRDVGGMLASVSAVHPELVLGDAIVEIRLGLDMLLAAPEDVEDATGVRHCQHCGFCEASIFDLDGCWCSERCREANRQPSEVDIWRRYCPETAAFVDTVEALTADADRLGVPAVAR